MDAYEDILFSRYLFSLFLISKWCQTGLIFKFYKKNWLDWLSRVSLLFFSVGISTLSSFRINFSGKSLLAGITPQPNELDRDRNIKLLAQETLIIKNYVTLEML